MFGVSEKIDYARTQLNNGSFERKKKGQYGLYIKGVSGKVATNYLEKNGPITKEKLIEIRNGLTPAVDRQYSEIRGQYSNILAGNNPAEFNFQEYGARYSKLSDSMNLFNLVTLALNNFDKMSSLDGDGASLSVDDLVTAAEGKKAPSEIKALRKNRFDFKA